MSLGFWQLHRAEEKKIIERSLSHAVTFNINSISNVGKKDLQYRPLSATGHFDNNHIILLDNKTYQQRVGYHVLTPFVLKDDNKILLVDRGFIESKNRHELPYIQTLNGERTITGLIYFPSKMFMLKNDTFSVYHWPLTLQTYDTTTVAGALNHSIYPFYLLLQSAEESNLIRDWHPVNFPSYRHKGYAIQWFSLAATLVLIYLILNTSRVRIND